MAVPPSFTTPAFARLHRVLLRNDGAGLRCTLAHFAAARYVPALFHQSGIDLPPAVQASVARRQAEFLAGRLCARDALQRLGMAPATVASGAYREPVWPAGCIGSISHTDGHAAAVVLPATAGAGVGLDLEVVACGDALAALAATVVSPAELASLLDSGGERAALLTLAFSAKESFFKAAFAQLGRYIEFDGAEVTGVDAQRGVVALRLRQTLAPGLPQGLPLAVRYQWLNRHTVCTHLVL